MFEKILIANRGEIACRVVRTAQRMGIKCVAVYSDADANAMHVAMADEAYRLGPAPARDSYLKADLILQIAKESGAQAIHPGYGFLSENADFARACENAGVEFIGPPASAIDAMGSKSAAKEIMEEAEVPLVQGYHGENQDPDFLHQQADEIGYPVLIKATAGGGGKGMRIVWKSDEFKSALTSCKREASASFGDDKVLVEKYLTKPRHVEIQVFADKHGNAVHLFERDCSVQRRHQKVIEEAPAPGLDDAKRHQMGDVAIRAAQAIGYVGAGTVEFLYDEDGSFYFMEMNTRLQVEHPVTEYITGQDLVEWQLRVANGHPLPLQQSDLEINGHALEVRVYAEDPNQDFLPSIGTLHHLSPPDTNEHVRIDTGVRQGDEVSVHYDPMIAKLIVWDHDRDAALARLRGALADYQVVGVTTNIEFLQSLAANKAFNNANLDTGFIEREKEDLFAAGEGAGKEVLAAAALHEMFKQQEEGEMNRLDSLDPYSPWHLMNGWRLNEDNHHDFVFVESVDGVQREHNVVVHFRNNGYLIEIDGEELQLDGRQLDDGVRVNLGGKRFNVRVLEQANQMTVFLQGKRFELAVQKQGLGEADSQGGGNLTAPMPGTIIQVMVAAGDKVEAGQPLLVLEAMKMEHTINAPADGTVSEVFFNEGDLVQDGVELLAFEAEQ